jgi:hypothetical protein
MLTPGLGLGTRFQTLPFQWMIMVLPLLVMPTAQALRADVAATPDRLPFADAGLGICVHTWPFHRSIRALDPSSTTPNPDDRYRRVRVTHPFHPLAGRDFEFVAHRRTWPWKDAFLTCWRRLSALPAPA